MVHTQASHQYGIIPPIAEEEAYSVSCSMEDWGLAKQFAQDSREGLDVEKVRDRREREIVEHPAEDEHEKHDAGRVRQTKEFRDHRGLISRSALL